MVRESEIISKLAIATSGRLSSEFAQSVRRDFPFLTIDVLNRTQLAAKIQSYSCYAGFDELGGLDVSHLTWIHSFGAGVDSFLQNATIRNNRIPISRSTGEMGKKIGEYCLAHVLGHYQHIPTFKEFQKSAAWKEIEPQHLAHTNVLILGTGTIGKGVASTFRPLTEKVVGTNQRGSDSKEFDAVISLGDVYDISTSVSIVINTLPLTKNSTHLLDYRFFEAFRHVIFINVGRGRTVVEEDLLNAIEKKFVRHAVLDVFDPEPLNAVSPLWQHPAITITPHVSGLTTLEDVKKGFVQAYDCLDNENYRNSPLFVDYDKGY